MLNLTKWISMLLLLAAPLGCAPGDKAASRVLPTLAELPIQINEHCACLEDGQCLILEQRAGRAEARKLRCRWEKRNEIADCNFEQRFVAFYFGEAEQLPQEVAEAWQPRRLQVQPMASGGWCAKT